LAAVKEEEEEEDHTTKASRKFEGKERLGKGW
jgi:hypothetical protein